MPKVSIVIPSKNSEKTIKEAIEFWLKQDFKDIEIIVVDDSQDKTREIVRKIAGKSKKVRLYLGKNKGPGVARNVGLRRASGELIHFSDSDLSMEIFDRTLLSRMVSSFKEKTDVSYIKYRPFTKGNFLRSIINVKSFSFRKATDHLPEMYRKKLLEKIKGFDNELSFGEDRDMALRAIEQSGKIGIAEGERVMDANISSISRLFKQGKWYGKTIMKYSRKSGNFLPVFKVLFYTFSLFALPMVYYSYVFAAPIILVILISYFRAFMKGFDNFIYKLFIPFIDLLHSFAVFLGMIRL